MMAHPFLTPSPDEVDGGHLIGRDPRAIRAEEWAAVLPDAQVGMKAIRAKCLDCAGGNTAEVRKCVSVKCALWPLRMGGQPRGLAEYRKGKDADESESKEEAA